MPLNLLDNLIADSDGEVASESLIPVPISYEIIRLFSEGLYQSPHKAVEELVANSFDAGAKVVSLVIPGANEDGPTPESLWVIDDGCGMDDAGFRQLWLVAKSPKSNLEIENGRKQIGQFGIGKLAAFVLSWRITHISKGADARYRYTSMNFRDVTGHHQNEPDEEPAAVNLRVINENRARALLSEIESADPDSWNRLFGPAAADTWTAAALSDFKDLFAKLRIGTLGWVLRTGLPLVSDFQMFVNGNLLEASKESGTVLHELTVGAPEDATDKVATAKYLNDGVAIDGIIGVITGSARLFESPLTSGKSDRFGRSNGFFVRVRGRVINLEDELFGLPPQNHAAWSRFVMEIEADGLRDYLLSSREGVRDSEPIRELRGFLHRSFNICRQAYESGLESDRVEIEIASIISDAPAQLAVDPLYDAIRTSVEDGSESSFYIKTPQVDDADAWLQEAHERITEKAFTEFEVDAAGDPWSQLCTYDAQTGKLSLNGMHPFASRIVAHSKNDHPAALVAASEVFTDALVRNSGLPPHGIHELLEKRDRILRVIAGDQASLEGTKGIDVPTVVRHLRVAHAHPDALERSVGRAFAILGLEYEPRGGYQGGPDGILRARLGRGPNGRRSFAIVYDAKTASGPIPAGQVDIQGLLAFAKDESAQYSLVVGKQFRAEINPSGALNKRLANAAQDGNNVTALLTADLIELVKLHYKFGVTFADLRDLFERAHTLPETRNWVVELKARLELSGPLPIRTLLNALEREHLDEHARPNVIAARTKDEVLKQYPPERLGSALKAAAELLGERWLTIDDHFNVHMEQSAARISEEFQRRAIDELDMDSQLMFGSF